MTAWLSVFPRDQLLVLQYEKLAQDPRATVERVIRFVGAPPALEDVAAWREISKIVRKLSREQMFGGKLLRPGGETEAVLREFFRPYNHVRSQSRRAPRAQRRRHAPRSPSLCLAAVLAASFGDFRMSE